MDGTTDRRHLTAARALVLDILAGASPLTSEQIVTEWTARQPDMSARHRQQLPRMLSEILWRLTNLEWVATTVGAIGSPPPEHRCGRTCPRRAMPGLDRQIPLFRAVIDCYLWIQSRRYQH